MLTRNELFGILTGLVEEHRKTENFFQALNFKGNFFKINTIMNGLVQKFESLDIQECFDSESKRVEQREFRYISFIAEAGLEDYIKDNYSHLIDTIHNNGKIVELTIK